MVGRKIIWYRRLIIKGLQSGRRFNKRDKSLSKKGKKRKNIKNKVWDVINIIIDRLGVGKGSVKDRKTHAKLMMMVVFNSNNATEKIQISLKKMDLQKL